MSIRVESVTGALCGGLRPPERVRKIAAVDERQRRSPAGSSRTTTRRVHPETGQTPNAGWIGQGWLPRTPDTLEDLDLLLVMVAAPRTVHRDGIHYQGLRYLAPTLAPYVKDKVTIRYDPRDLGEIRVFHRDRFLCRAISDARAGESLTLADIKTARTARRRDLRAGLNIRVTAGDQYSRTETNASPPTRRPRPGRKLAVYFEDKT